MLIQETGSRIEGANSYATSAYADEYFTHHAKSATWQGLSNDAKATALVTATRILDASFNWKGTQASAEQSLEWPRCGVVIAVAAATETLAANKIPIAILRAQCEVAILCAEGDRMADSASAGVAKLGVGDGAIEVAFDPSTKANPCGELAPLLVRNYVRGNATKGTTADIVRS